MTREEVARKIRWAIIIWVLGWINVTAMLPQLYTLITTRDTGSVNVKMFWIYLATQLGFSVEGFFRRNVVLCVSLGLSAIVSIATISVFYYFSP